MQILLLFFNDVSITLVSKESVLRILSAAVFARVSFKERPRFYDFYFLLLRNFLSRKVNDLDQNFWLRVVFPIASTCEMSMTPRMLRQNFFDVLQTEDDVLFTRAQE